MLGWSSALVAPLKSITHPAVFFVASRKVIVTCFRDVVLGRTFQIKFMTRIAHRVNLLRAEPATDTHFLTLSHDCLP